MPTIIILPIILTAIPADGVQDGIPITGDIIPVIMTGSIMDIVQDMPMAITVDLIMVVVMAIITGISKDIVVTEPIATLPAIPGILTEMPVPIA